MHLPLWEVMVIETGDEKSMIPSISARKMNDEIKKTPGQTIPSVKIEHPMPSLPSAVVRHLILMILNPCLSQFSSNVLARCNCLGPDKRANNFCACKTEYETWKSFLIGFIIPYENGIVHPYG